MQTAHGRGLATALGRNMPGMAANVAAQELESNPLAIVSERVCNRIAEGRPCPVYPGAATGELTVTSSAVILQHREWSTLRVMNQGVLKLPEDDYIHCK